MVVLLLALFFRFTIVGKAMRACATNRPAASLVGIPWGLWLPEFSSA
jgi:branched-subunit amino acid ABC-type transport system permease component